MGPLQLAVTWYKFRHAGEQAVHWDIQNKATLFWMSQCVACSPAWWILYHVTASCKGSIGRALHRYRRGHGFESRSSLNFFRLSFRNYLRVPDCNFRESLARLRKSKLLIIYLKFYLWGAIFENII